MKKIVLYGAGYICRSVLPHLAGKYEIIAIVDADPAKWGTCIMEIPVISIQEYLDRYSKHEIVITAGMQYMEEIFHKFKELGISRYSAYYDNLSEGEAADERIIAYSAQDQLEDVILYHVLKDCDEVFYIDVGCNDPFKGSVTKLFYDTKNAHGINIDPLREMIALTNRERPRDINICAGVGNFEGEAELYVQGGLSTLLKQNVLDAYSEGKENVKITTLSKICRQYVPDKTLISFLKIDVEGYEKEVLQGADFNLYRPMIVVVESTLPMTYEPCHENWEYILTENNYHFVFSYGVNRYYVADEHRDLVFRFVPVSEIMKEYKVCHAFSGYCKFRIE